MADINQVITLGIGTPASIEHLTLVGLSPTGSVGPSGQVPAASRYRLGHRSDWVHTVWLWVLTLCARG